MNSNACTGSRMPSSCWARQSSIHLRANSVFSSSSGIKFGAKAVFRPSVLVPVNNSAGISLHPKGLWCSAALFSKMSSSTCRYGYIPFATGAKAFLSARCAFSVFVCPAHETPLFASAPRPTCCTSAAARPTADHTAHAVHTHSTARQARFARGGQRGATKAACTPPPTSKEKPRALARHHHCGRKAQHRIRGKPGAKQQHGTKAPPGYDPRPDKFNTHAASTAHSKRNASQYLGE